MRRTICIWLLLVGLALLPSSAHSGTHSAYHSRTAYSSHSRSRSSTKSAHVRSYTGKDGTYVSAHSHSLPETSNIATSTPRSSRSRTPRASIPRTYSHHSRSGPIHSADGVTRDKHGRIKRSSEAKDAFKRQRPCPSTGKSSGPCPGYVIDHVKPLECGGTDAPSNMQWQTIADGKAKDKTERNCR
jgi:hypothetical protein